MTYTVEINRKILATLCFHVDGKCEEVTKDDLEMFGLVEAGSTDDPFQIFANVVDDLRCQLNGALARVAELEAELERRMRATEVERDAVIRDLREQLVDFIEDRIESLESSRQDAIEERDTVWEKRLREEIGQLRAWRQNLQQMLLQNENSV